LLQWRKERENLLRPSSARGLSVDSVGPIWLGRRVASSVAGPGSYSDLIYSKGGYVLHMLRMMFYDFGNPDRDRFFKAMMQDFCRTFENKPASTEDFKAMVEKHMTANMVMDRSRNMDWFFDQYVYGTGIPSYQFSYTTEPLPDGKMKLSGKITRSGVPDDWKDLVALYAHQGQGIIRLGFIHAVQPVMPFEAVVPSTLRSFTVNDFEDLLAEVTQQQGL
jgi:aminopeptidase N